MFRLAGRLLPVLLLFSITTTSLSDEGDLTQAPTELPASWQEFNKTQKTPRRAHCIRSVNRMRYKVGHLNLWRCSLQISNSFWKNDKHYKIKNKLKHVPRGMCLRLGSMFRPLASRLGDASVLFVAASLEDSDSLRPRTAAASSLATVDQEVNDEAVGLNGECFVGEEDPDVFRWTCGGGCRTGVDSKLSNTLKK